MTHICVNKVTIIGSDNGLSPGRRQAIIWTNAGILLIGSIGTNFNEILIGIQTFSFKKMHLKMASAKWRLFCRGLNELTCWIVLQIIKDMFRFWIVSWIWHDPSRWNELWNNKTCCPFHTANTMPADALATLGASASTGMILTPKAGIFRLRRDDSWLAWVLFPSCAALTLYVLNFAEGT